MALSRETCADSWRLHSSSASFAHDANKWPHSVTVTECADPSFAVAALETAELFRAKTQQLLQPVQAHTTARLVHAKCNILAWNLVLVGCPLKVRSYLRVLQKVASELHPKVRNHGEGPY